MMRVFIAFFALSRVAFADGYQISELDTYDPFVEEFLVICGEVALSKDQSPYAGTDIERRLTSRSGVEIYYNGSYMFCSFFSSYYSDASSFDVEDPSDHQPWWLKEPENIADSFDRWIEKIVPASISFQPTAASKLKPKKIALPLENTPERFQLERPVGPLWSKSHAYQQVISNPVAAITVLWSPTLPTLL
jgi:hypothetical protein